MCSLIEEIETIQGKICGQTVGRSKNRMGKKTPKKTSRGGERATICGEVPPTSRGGWEYQRETTAGQEKKYPGIRKQQQGEPSGNRGHRERAKGGGGVYHVDRSFGRKKKRGHRFKKNRQVGESNHIDGERDLSPWEKRVHGKISKKQITRGKRQTRRAIKHRKGSLQIG